MDVTEMIHPWLVCREESVEALLRMQDRLREAHHTAETAKFDRDGLLNTIANKDAYIQVLQQKNDALLKERFEAQHEAQQHCLNAAMRGDRSTELVDADQKRILEVGQWKAIAEEKCVYIRSLTARDKATRQEMDAEAADWRAVVDTKDATIAALKNTEIQLRKALDQALRGANDNRSLADSHAESRMRASETAAKYSQTLADIKKLITQTGIA